MTFRLSLRKKLVYTFLGGSLLTVGLFSLVIKGIMNDYFQRLADVRLQFVSELGQREIRTNVTIFKISSTAWPRRLARLRSLARSAIICRKLPRNAAEWRKCCIALNAKPRFR